MTLTSTISDIAILTIANIVSNLAWFVLIIWGVKIISREIGKGIKQIPVWLQQYEETIMKKRAIDNALGRMER